MQVTDGMCSAVGIMSCEVLNVPKIQSGGIRTSRWIYSQKPVMTWLSGSPELSVMVSRRKSENSPLPPHASWCEMCGGSMQIQGSERYLWMCDRLRFLSGAGIVT
jgi:hypothetical protein